MTQALPKPITFEDFLDWKAETGRYELHDETVIEMQPVGPDLNLTAEQVFRVGVLSEQQEQQNES